MARRSGQKIKLFSLLEILWEQTDEEHPLTLSELISALEARGISAERKSLYSDFEALDELGFSVECVRDRTVAYYLASRPFELVELKLLVDAVQSSKFITEKKSAQLISKLESLVSRHEAKTLAREVHVAGRIKAMNESIYYSVDEIQRAIAQNRKISFQYFSWDTEKQRVLRRDGAHYVVSPYLLLWDDENYYLVGFEEEKQKILHFRVDKMLRIELCEEERDGKAEFEKLDPTLYTRRVFSMYGGKEEYVTLRLSNALVGVILDRFGREVPLMRDGKEHFTVTVPVHVSPQFFGWLASLGADARVLAPKDVHADYTAYLKAALEAQG
ncbi:MAG: WYL domain-containing protein [Clostridia bacterium]|nr:WYL domain-containing protein [Clostridia bacterium]